MSGEQTGRRGGSRQLKYKFGVPRIDDVIGGVDGGTNVLVAGSSPSANDEFLRRCVSEGVENDEGVVYVTTDKSAEDLLESYGADGNDRFGVVDCVSESQGVDVETSATVKTAGSPSDMTGIGIQVSDVLDDFWEGRGIERNRVCLDSVSTLLMYSDLEAVFRFLHVFTGRVRSIDGVGFFVINPGMHDEREYSTLRQLFDGAVEVRDDGGTEVRVTGLTNGATDWVALG
jgi:KaiC/GvpD/RAD55 family RecA-like ATPase